LREKCAVAASAVAAAVRATRMDVARRTALAHVVGPAPAEDGTAAVVIAAPSRRWWDTYYQSEEYKELQRQRATGVAAGSMVFNTLLHAIADVRRFCRDPLVVPSDKQTDVNSLVDKAVDVAVQLLVVVSPSSPVLPLSGHSDVDVALPCCCCSE